LHDHIVNGKVGRAARHLKILPDGAG